MGYFTPEEDTLPRYVQRVLRHLTAVTFSHQGIQGSLRISFIKLSLAGTSESRSCSNEILLLLEHSLSTVKKLIEFVRSQERRIDCRLHHLEAFVEGIVEVLETLLKKLVEVCWSVRVHSILQV